MMNTRETLKNLHKKFPNLNLDDLFEIMDCYVEDTITSKTSWINNDVIIKPYYGRNISTTSITGNAQLTASH